MEKKISVIVPVYNIKQYLPRCIDSIIKQSFREMEIILVDDGSTDQSGQICDEYAKKDGRIRVIHKKENEGLVNARKTGMLAATGSLIAYVDGDDWIEPDMYEVMYRKLVTENVDIVMCGRYEDVGNIHKKVFHGSKEGRYGKKELLQLIYPEMIAGKEFFEWHISPSVCDKLFRRECIEKFQLSVDERITMGEDAACTYPSLLHADSIYMLERYFYHYRQSSGSMVKRTQDYAKERRQFQILYRTVNQQFLRDKDIFDLREQWKKYILFLMIPRADGLYSGFEKLNFLFPFSGVKKKSDIVLYGAGTYGQRLYSYLQRTDFCNVVAWVDRNYGELRKFGLQVDQPGIIADLKYDAIVVANTYEKSRMGLYQELIKKYSKEKVHLIDTELIFSKKSLQAFGLTE